MICSSLLLASKFTFFVKNRFFTIYGVILLKQASLLFLKISEKVVRSLKRTSRIFVTFRGPDFWQKKLWHGVFLAFFFFLESGVYDGLLDLLTGGIWHDDRCISCVICYSLFVSAWGRGQGGLRPKKGWVRDLRSVWVGSLEVGSTQLITLTCWGILFFG